MAILKNNTDQVLTSVAKRFRQENKQIAEEILQLAQEYAPVDTGLLVSSGRVVQQVRALKDSDLIFTRLTGGGGYAVTFGANGAFYARYQEFAPYNRLFLTRATKQVARKYKYRFSSETGIKEMKTPFENFNEEILEGFF